MNLVVWALTPRVFFGNNVALVTTESIASRHTQTPQITPVIMQVYGLEFARQSNGTDIGRNHESPRQTLRASMLYKSGEAIL